MFLIYFSDMNRRSIRRIATLRRVQNAYNEHRVCELVMNKTETIEFIIAIFAAYERMLKNDSELMIHFLSTKNNIPSAYFPELEVQRLNVLVDVIEDKVQVASLSSDDCQHQLVDFLNKIGDI